MCIYFWKEENDNVLLSLCMCLNNFHFRLIGFSDIKFLKIINNVFLSKELKYTK